MEDFVKHISDKPCCWQVHWSLQEVCKGWIENFLSSHQVFLWSSTSLINSMHKWYLQWLNYENCLCSVLQLQVVCWQYNWYGQIGKLWQLVNVKSFCQAFVFGKIALTQTCAFVTILPFLLCIAAGKIHELGKYYWFVAFIGNVHNVLHNKLQINFICMVQSSLIKNFVMNIFYIFAKALHPLKDHLQYIFEVKENIIVGRKTLVIPEELISISHKLKIKHQ